MVNPKHLPARVNQHVAIVRVCPSEAEAKFVFYTINSPHHKSRLLALAQGGAHAIEPDEGKAAFERFRRAVETVLRVGDYI